MATRLRGCIQAPAPVFRAIPNGIELLMIAPELTDRIAERSQATGQPAGQHLRCIRCNPRRSKSYALGFGSGLSWKLCGRLPFSKELKPRFPSQAGAC